MRKAIYAGSFDPPTRGHLLMIEAGAELFDELIVLVAVNPTKRTLLTAGERCDIIAKSITHLPNVSVDTLESDYTVRYAERIRAQYLLRGIRSYTDLEPENVLREANERLTHDLNLPPVRTWFYQLPVNESITSSSMVKQLIGSPERPTEGWELAVARYVPRATLEALKKKFNAA